MMALAATTGEACSTNSLAFFVAAVGAGAAEGLEVTTAVPLSALAFLRDPPLLWPESKRGASQNWAF